MHSQSKDNPDPDAVKTWEKSVLGNPWLFKGRLNPTFDLVKDKAIKEQLKEASQAYMDSSKVRVSPCLGIYGPLLSECTE